VTTPNESPTPDRGRRIVASRAALLASAAGIALLAFAAGATTYRQPPLAPAAQSTTVARASLADFSGGKTALAEQPFGFADLVARIRPAVVSVRVEITEPVSATGSDALPQQGGPLERFFQFGAPNAPNAPNVAPDQQMVGEGSGFFISADGYIVTNDHVVDHAKSVQVTADDGSVYKARVIGTDPKTDLAVIKVDGSNTFPHVMFAAQAPRVGDWVVAIGNPFGLGNTVTAGIVSALGRDINDSPYDSYMQIDAPINRGNSGGPTFNFNGEVVGINSMIFSPSGGSVGIGFDIPADTAKSITTALIQSGHITRGWLGVQIQDVTPDIAAGLGMKQAAGALVAQIETGSPAAQAGIKAGDVITAVNGTSVKDSRALVQEIGAMTPGSSVKLEVLRKEKPETVALTLGEMPAEQQTPPA
jgi:serine protease Do